LRRDNAGYSQIPVYMTGGTLFLHGARMAKVTEVVFPKDSSLLGLRN